MVGTGVGSNGVGITSPLSCPILLPPPRGVFVRDNGQIWTRVPLSFLDGRQIPFGDNDADRAATSAKLERQQKPPSLRFATLPSFMSSLAAYPIQTAFPPSPLSPSLR